MLCIVTGADGFIGRVPCQRLAKGFTVLGVEPGYHSGMATIREAEDLLHRTQGPRMVFHFGAIARTDALDAAVLRALNVESSAEWARECERHGVPLVFASSFGVYGNGPKEAVGRYCQTPYAESKWAAEVAIRKIHPRGAAILRLSNVYGRGEERKGDQAFCYRAAQTLVNGAPVRVYDPDPRRDWVSVDRVAAVCHAIAFRHQNGQAFRAGEFEVGGERHTFTDVVGLVAEAIGRLPAIVRSPLPESMVGRYQLDTESDPAPLRRAVGFTGDPMETALKRWLGPIFGRR